MRLYTSYFAKQKSLKMDDAVYVSVAVSDPKYGFPYKLEHLKLLAPYGLFGYYDGEVFKRKYFEKLDKIGAGKIKEELIRLSGGHENVILLCHEKNENECHRRMFAEWWKKQTGEEIVEAGKEKEKKEKTAYEQLTLML